jgi:hypothetical protein
MQQSAQPTSMTISRAIHDVDGVCDQLRRHRLSDIIMALSMSNRAQSDVCMPNELSASLHCAISAMAIDLKCA